MMATRHPTSTNSIRGVTLLELLVSVAILGAVASLLWGTFSRTWAGRVYAESRAATFATARSAVSWLERDIAGGGSAGSYPAGPALFVSKGVEQRESQDLDTPLLHLTTASALGTAALEVALGRDVPLPGPQRAEQARVLYRLERAEQDGGPPQEPLALVRYEWRPASDEERELASRVVLARDIISIRLRFSLNGTDWKEEWEAGTGRSNVLPNIVETRLVLADASGQPVEFVSATTVIAGGQPSG